VNLRLCLTELSLQGFTLATCGLLHGFRLRDFFADFLDAGLRQIGFFTQSFDLARPRQQALMRLFRRVEDQAVAADAMTIAGGDKAARRQTVTKLQRVFQRIRGIGQRQPVGKKTRNQRIVGMDQIGQQVQIALAGRRCTNRINRGQTRVLRIIKWGLSPDGP
jgi:hypothetical protein